MGTEAPVSWLFSITPTSTPAPQPFLFRQGNRVPVTSKVRPRKLVGFWSACLRSGSHLFGGPITNWLVPSQMAYFRQKVEQKAFSCKSAWRDFHTK